MIISDFTKAPEQIIVDLINHDNGTALTTDLLAFGLPSVLAVGPHNTKVTTTAKPGSVYVGSVDISYNRVDLATIPGARSVVFPQTPALKISDIVEALNTRYQLNLTPVDYVDADLPVFTDTVPHSELPFTLQAGVDSLIFIGSVVLRILRSDILLSDVIINRSLNGLVYNQPA